MSTQETYVVTNFICFCLLLALYASRKYNLLSFKIDFILTVGLIVGLLIFFILDVTKKDRSRQNKRRRILVITAHVFMVSLSIVLLFWGFFSLKNILFFDFKIELPVSGFVPSDKQEKNTISKNTLDEQIKNYYNDKFTSFILTNTDYNDVSKDTSYDAVFILWYLMGQNIFETCKPVMPTTSDEELVMKIPNSDLDVSKECIDKYFENSQDLFKTYFSENAKKK